MQLLCLGNIALNEAPFQLPGWEAPQGFAPGPGTHLLLDWEAPLPEPLSAAPRRTGPLTKKPEGRQGLQRWAPGIVTLAGERSLPVRADALAPTLLMLQQAGFKTVGGGMTPEEAGRPLLWGTAEGELTILNWSLSKPSDSAADISPNHWPGLLEAGRMIRAVRQTSDWVMVVLRWEDAPYPHPLPAHRELAFQLAELGANLIIGQHPFGVRGMEFAGGSPVFYGLGTFYASGAVEGGEGGDAYDPQRGRISLGVQFSFKHGQPPGYEFFSFAWDQNQVFLDPLQRAFRRLNSASLTLHDHPVHMYREWYDEERQRAHRWTGRLSMGSLRKGVTDRLRKLT